VYRALPGSERVSETLARRTLWTTVRGQLTVDGCLTAQLLEHLGRPRQSIARLAHRDVEDELLDAELPHGVVGLFRLENLLEPKIRD